MIVSKHIFARLMTAILCAVLALWTTVIAGCTKESSQVENEVRRLVKTYELVPQTANRITSLVGLVDAPEHVALSFQRDGRLTELPVLAGNTIKAGAVIARQDDGAPRLAVAKARAELALMTLELERLTAIHARNLTADADLDAANARHELAAIALADAERALKETTLTAPYDALVIDRYVANHDFVTQGEAVVSLAPVGKRDIITYVPETVMAKIGLPALTRVEIGFPQTPKQRWQAALREYTATATPVSRAYKLHFDLDGEFPETLLPGMSAQVYITLTDKQDASITLPVAALNSTANGDFFVWQVRENRLIAIPVAIDEMASEWVSVSAPLTLGDEVVLAGANLEAGMVVSIVQSPNRL